MFFIFSCRSFYIRWKNPNAPLRVYVGSGSDPRTNRILYADFCRLPQIRNIHHILISTASDCLGEWQIATGTLLIFQTLKLYHRTLDKQKAKYMLNS